MHEKRLVSPLNLAAAVVIAVLCGLLVAAFLRIQAQETRLAAIEAQLAAGNSTRLSPATPATMAALPLPPRAGRPRLKDANTNPRTRRGQVQDVETRAKTRLGELHARFVRERVDDAWATRAEADVRDMLAYAIASSGFRPSASSVACRSHSCRIDVDMPMAADPDDLLLQLSADAVEMLPRSKTVIVPDGAGNKRLTIFATR